MAMKKSFCQHTEKILGYRLGLLSKAEVQTFEEHLKACAVCTRELQIESTIEKALAVELQPGFIEDYVCARVRVQSTRNMRSFWLYALRMTAYGLVAAILGFSLIPQFIKFLFEEQHYIAISTGALSELITRTSNSATGLFVIMGLGIILIIASSIYSLGYIRK